MAYKTRIAYDLDTLASFSKELGLQVLRPNDKELRVLFPDAPALIFLNYELEDGQVDSMIRFDCDQGSWHDHGKIIFVIRGNEVLELDELDVVQAIVKGGLLLAENFIDGVLQDRWLHHQHQQLDFEYLGPGEEQRFRRIIREIE